MKKQQLFLFGAVTFLSSGLFATTAGYLNHAPVCSTSLQQGQVCYVTDMKNIHAGQFNYGAQYVNNWVQENKLIEPDAYEQKVLKSNLLSIVIAPNGQIFLVDGHHRSRATMELAREEQHQYKIYLKVFKKFPLSQSPKAMDAFWSWMTSTNNIWLEDQGVYKNKKYLPKSVIDTTNDKYRSLAGWLAESGWCFNNQVGKDVNYLEFYWADYFRDLVKQGKLKAYPDPDITTKQGAKVKATYFAYIQQSGLCHAKQAKHLPGYCRTDNCTPVLVS